MLASRVLLLAGSATAAFDLKKLSTYTTAGDAGLYYRYDKEGTGLVRISPWHDIPFTLGKDEHGVPLLSFVCEIPRGTRAKFEIHKSVSHNPHAPACRKVALAPRPANPGRLERTASCLRSLEERLSPGSAPCGGVRRCHQPMRRSPFFSAPRLLQDVHKNGTLRDYVYSPAIINYGTCMPCTCHAHAMHMPCTHQPCTRHAHAMHTPPSAAACGTCEASLAGRRTARRAQPLTPHTRTRAGQARSRRRGRIRRFPTTTRCSAETTTRSTCCSSTRAAASAAPCSGCACWAGLRSSTAARPHGYIY